MHKKFKWLQLFADGAPAGDGGAASDGGGGTETGVTPDAAGQETVGQRLEKLGVPKSKIDARAYKEPAKAPKQAAAAENTEDKGSKPDSAKTPFKELMKDPEYNREMQSIVSQAKKKSQKAESDLEALSPALSLLAKKHGLKIAEDGTFDINALAAAISNDDDLYEEKAIELGVSTDVAKQLDKAEKIIADQKKAEEDTVQQQMFRQHMEKLENEAAEFKKSVPGFDLRKELENDAFRSMMMQPGRVISVEDAYFAVHRKEILGKTVNQTKQQMSNAIQAGQNRPQEGGMPKSTNASVGYINWHNASPEQLEAQMRKIKDAQVRGVKLYPGR